MTDNTNVDKPNAVALTPMGMLQIAVEQGADVEKLERLMALQERWEANEARKAYIAAMMEFQAECPFIEKSREGHNIKYANLADALKQIRDLMKANGFSHTWKTEQTDAILTVTCCVTHREGHRECSSMSAGADKTGSKNDVQAIGSTNTYLQRYTLFSVLGLASVDQDDDANKANVELISPEQKDKIIGLLKETETDTVKFLAFMRYPTIDDIQTQHFQAAINALSAKKAPK